MLFRSVDIPLLTQLLSPLEGMFKRLRASNVPLSSEGVRLLGQSADAVDQVMAQFDAAEPQLPQVEVLTAQILAMRDRYPESQVAHVVYEPHAEESEHMTDEAATDDAAMTASLDASMAEAAAGDSAPVSAETLIEEPAVAAVDPEDAHHAELAAELVAALGAFEPETAVAERAAAEQVAAEKAAAEKLAAEQMLAEQAAERAAVEQAMAEQAAVEQAAAEQREAERVAEQAAIERVQAEQAAEKAAAELAAAERAAVEQAAAERTAAEQAAAEQQAAAQAAAATPPEPAFALAGSGHIDADLLEVFIDEAREILDHADDALAQWHAEPTDLSPVAELQRDLHTLKGGARIAGLMPVGDLSHAIETLLEKPIRDLAKTGPLITALEASFDQLHALVQQVSQGVTPDYPQAAIDRLLALAGETTLADDAVLAAVAMPAAKAVKHAPTAALPGAATAGELPELLPEMEEEVRSSQEQIRVRADLLDSLVNHAGEVAIYRSRLEQQVAGYRFNLVELEQTVARLRSQLRMLEIETEAQIIDRKSVV